MTQVLKIDETANIGRDKIRRGPSQSRVKKHAPADIAGSQQEERVNVLTALGEGDGEGTFAYLDWFAS